MDPNAILLTISLVLLTAALGVLSARAFAKYWRTRVMVQVWWAGGLALATGAMAVETVVFVGILTEPLLQAYVFLSGALVGVLSIGATRVLRRPRLELGYSVYIVLACVVLGVFSFSTRMPMGMVTEGIITGNPPLSLIVLSTLITGPATVVLLLSSASALRRSHDWRTLLLVAGALVLGAGGTLYIASFPVALYYAEFIGIVLLFAGLVSLKPVMPPAPAVRPAST